MALAASDTFTRADSTNNLGTTETGSLTWSSVNGTFGISSNQGYDSSVTTDSIAVVDAGIADFNAYITIVTYDATNFFEQGLYFRVSSTTNWWRIVRSDTHYIVQKMVSGTKTTVYNQVQVLANGDIFKVDTN